MVAGVGQASWVDAATRFLTASVSGSGGGFDIRLELATDALPPGRLVDGRLAVTARDGGSFRGARVTLVGTETWRHDVTVTDADGHTRTETRTDHDDLPLVPVAALPATSLGPGESRVVDVQLPVPSLGPPTFEATEFAVAWEVRATLDVPGFDHEVILPVRILQPTAALRAGTVDVGQFALWDSADVAADGMTGTVRLEPVPLCLGAPFRGELALTGGEARDVQEVRLELRVQAKATVSGGREETLTVWAARIAGEGAFGGGAATYPFEGTLGDRLVPTLRTEHGRADATFHVVVAVAWARDPHLVRDVAICSTTEL